MDYTMRTELGDLFFEDTSAGEYCLFASPAFLESVLYNFHSSNKDLIAACENAHLEQEPILVRDKSDYGFCADAAYIDFANVIAGMGVNVFES